MAYKTPHRWNADHIRIDLLADVSEGNVATVEVQIGALSLRFMGEVVESDHRLAVVGVHVSSTGVNPNDVGLSNLKLIAKTLMEFLGYDEIVVDGAVRTTGARPGHRPRKIRIAGNGNSAAQS